MDTSVKNNFNISQALGSNDQDKISVSDTKKIREFADLAGIFGMSQDFRKEAGKQRQEYNRLLDALGMRLILDNANTDGTAIAKATGVPNTGFSGHSSSFGINVEAILGINDLTEGVGKLSEFADKYDALPDKHPLFVSMINAVIDFGKHIDQAQKLGINNPNMEERIIASNELSQANDARNLAWELLDISSDLSRLREHKQYTVKDFNHLLEQNEELSSLGFSAIETSNEGDITSPNIINTFLDSNPVLSEESQKLLDTYVKLMDVDMRVDGILNLGTSSLYQAKELNSVDVEKLYSDLLIVDRMLEELSN